MYLGSKPTQMKTIKLLSLFGIIAFTLFSCSKSNDELIVGTWQEIETGESILKYNKNGTYSFEYDNGNTESGKWRIKDKTLFTIIDGSDEELNEELTILDETKLVVTIGGRFQTSYEKVKEYKNHLIAAQ
jgi:hypothetical protein